MHPNPLTVAPERLISPPARRFGTTPSARLNARGPSESLRTCRSGSERLTGGALTTASGLIFVGATTDDHLRAIDLASGKTLWSDTLPAGGQSAPISYEQDGKQYVVIMAGGHHSMKTPAEDELIAYALPDRK